MNLFEIYFQNKNEFQNMHLDLDNINKALKESCFIQKSLGKIIHVAGTNGKGSTSYFIAQILEKLGYKTALFTSPHILDIKERFCVSLQNITEKEFDALFRKYRDIIENNKLSFFEAAFLIATIWFAINKPDFTILETGLGGRLDATNTNLINNKVCVITSISQDHAHILGNNIYQITDEKIKITRPSSPIFLGILKKSIAKYIKENLPNKIHETVVSEFAKSNYPFPYSENYSLAHDVVSFLIGKDIKNFKHLNLPQCRLEEIDNVILDGSHNPAGVLSLEKSGYTKNIETVIFTSTKDRCPSIILNILKKITNNIIFTSLSDNPRMLQEPPQGIECNVIMDPTEAFRTAKAKGGKILVTGSFFLCAYIKSKLQAGSL